jgi:hypothetical protein
MKREKVNSMSRYGSDQSAVLVKSAAFLQCSPSERNRAFRAIALAQCEGASGRSRIPRNFGRMGKTAALLPLN